MSLHVMSPTSESNRFNPRGATNFLGARGFGIRYPSPFFDVAQQFLPENVHQLHHWCRYYFLTNPIINVACQKMAEYPVTPIVWETEDDETLKLYRTVEDRLRLRQFRIETGLDYFVYGNAFASVFFQIEKYLVCPKCKARYRASTNRSLYKWKNGQFRLRRCQGCGYSGPAGQADSYLRNIRSARLVRWNPENIEIKHNEVTGQSRYYYRLPRKVVNDIKMGDPHTIETLPFQFLEAARRGRALLFNPDNFFHLKRPTIAQKDQGWGSPLIYPLLKDAFYMQIMKKAQESLLLEHVIPLRVIYPGPSTGGNETPYSSYNLGNWKRKIDAELNIWKRDHNYIPILPVNIGFQQLGGTAKALILHQEFRILSEHMLAGAGIPVEFVFGGLQFSASNTSLRALENSFLGYNKDSLTMMKFLIGKVAQHMQWPSVDFHFERFRMADDLQRSMFLFQLNQGQKISDRTMLEDIGYDADVEVERMDRELGKQLNTQRKMQIASADVQGAAQLRQSRYQAKAQALMAEEQMKAQMAAQQAGVDGEGGEGVPGGEPPPGMEDQDPSQQGGPAEAGGNEGAAGEPPDKAMPTALAGMESPIQAGQMGVDPRQMANAAANYLKTVREEAGADVMYQEMQKMQMENPQLYKLVVPLMQDQGSSVNPMNAMQSSTGSGKRPDGRMVG